MQRVRINWGRLIVMTALMTAVIAGTAFGLTRAAEPAPELRTVRVAPGDTLWGIAQQYGPAKSDLRRLTYDLERLNDLSGQMLRPGMELKLPAAWR